MAVSCKTWFVPQDRFRGLCSQVYDPKTGTDECPICVKPAAAPAFISGSCGCPAPSGEAGRSWTATITAGSEPGLLTPCEGNFVGTYSMNNRNSDYPQYSNNPYTCGFGSKEFAYMRPSGLAGTPCEIPNPIYPLPNGYPNGTYFRRHPRITISFNHPGQLPTVLQDGNKKYRVPVLLYMWYAPITPNDIFNPITNYIYSRWTTSIALPACDYYENFDIALEPIVSLQDRLLGIDETYWYKRFNVRLKGS